MFARLASGDLTFFLLPLICARGAEFCPGAGGGAKLRSEMNFLDLKLDQGLEAPEVGRGPRPPVPESWIEGSASDKILVNWGKLSSEG